MDFSPYAQNPYTMFNWMNPPASSQPSHCEVCGRALPSTAPTAPTATDWANQWYTTTYAPMMDNLTRMWSSMAQPWMAPGTAPSWPGTRPNPTGPGTHMQPHQHRHHQHHHHDCGCEQGNCDGCHGDNCHCRCCITDADLVVYARLGERRLVPLTVENSRRRERQVKLEISNWSSHGGTAGNVKSQIVGATEFTLAPCQEQEVILLIEATGTTDSGGNTPGTGGDTGTTAVGGRVLPDVDDCQVFYADLRVEGCDMRPVRIALALLPRDCANHKVDCGCSCC